MSTEFINDQWRLPNNENKDKQSNYSMDFSGSSQKIDLGNTDAVKLGAGDFTFSAWINPDSWGSSFQAIYANAGTNGVFIGKDDAGNFVLRIYYVSNIITYSTLPTVGAWTHICVTRDNGQCSLFYNGSSVATATSTHNFNASANVFVGSDNGGGDFNGKLDAVSIFDYALTDGTGGTVNQIAALYGSSSTGIGNPMSLSPKPVAYYPLGDQDAFNGANYLVPNSSLKDYVFGFSATSQIINFSTIDLGTTHTISMWVKFTATTFANIITGTGGSALRLNAPNRIYYLTYGYNSIQSYSIIPYNEWQNIVIIRNGTTIEFYVNNSRVLNNTSFSGNNFTFNKILGLDNNNDLSNLQLWDTNLSSTEIETLYNNGSPIETLASIPQNSNLKAWYKLDASEVYNSSTTEWSIDNNQNPSAYPTSLKFVASELDRIDMPSDTILNPSSNYTFSIWFNPTSSNSNSTLVGSSALGRGINMYYPPNNTKVTFYHKTSTANESFDIVFPDSPVNTWNNITITWSASTGIIRAFINGKYISQKENISDIVWGGTLRVGQYTSYAWYFDGQLSNLAMWDATLTDGFSGTPTTGDIAGGQVAEVYNNGTPQTTITGSPVGWWKLNNGGKFITDSSGNNFTATNHSGNFQTGGAIEHAGFVNTLVGNSYGMSQANLVQSDLSFTSGYSPYALAFDGSNDYIDCGNDSSLQITGNITFSTWVNIGTSTSTMRFINKDDGSNRAWIILFVSGKIRFIRFYTASSFYDMSSSISVNDSNWHHIACVNDSTGTAKIYIDGSEDTATTGTNTGTLLNNASVSLKLGGDFYQQYLNGKLSNCSIWNTNLSSSQVTEIYNEGVPSNLNNHSAYSNLVSWWQLGSNSSFNTNWTVLDEKGSNNGTSVNMDEVDIVDGVGSYANGLSSGMGGDEVIGSAPFSDANSLSVNMDVLDRSTDVPS